jgi:hypothetical protein
MKALGEMTAAEYRAHERAFGVELARNLRTARERIGWSQRRLERETGFQQTKICKIERGQHLVWVRELFAELNGTCTAHLVIQHDLPHRLVGVLACAQDMTERKTACAATSTGRVGQIRPPEHLEKTSKTAVFSAIAASDNNIIGASRAG